MGDVTGKGHRKSPEHRGWQVSSREQCERGRLRCPMRCHKETSLPPGPLGHAASRKKCGRLNGVANVPRGNAEPVIDDRDIQGVQRRTPNGNAIVFG